LSQPRTAAIRLGVAGYEDHLYACPLNVGQVSGSVRETVALIFFAAGGC